MLENITPPPLIRLLNLLGNLTDKVGVELFPITPKALFRVAKRRTGLTDLAEDNALIEATERIGYSEALVNVGGGRQMRMTEAVCN